jgi:hypothetical protein
MDNKVSEEHNATIFTTELDFVLCRHIRYFLSFYQRFEGIYKPLQKDVVFLVRSEYRLISRWLTEFRMNLLPSS